VPIYFDVWAAATPLGTALGELTSAYDKTYRREDNGLGSGQFTINRHDAQAAWCATGNLVRVRLTGGGPFAYDSANYVGAFWLDEGSDVPASTNEEGGETLTRGGRGELAYLEEGILPEVALTYPAGPQPDGTWLWTDEQLGSIWRRVIDEAQAMGFLPDMTYDFTDTVDTDGNPWLDFGGPFKLNIGLNLLAIADTLRAQGLRLNMTPALVCQAWQDYTSPNAGITFTVGDGGSIYDVAERKVHATPARSHILVQGATEDNVLTYRWVEDAGVESALGRPKAGFVRYGNTPTNALLDRAGQKQIDDLQVQREGPTTIGVYPRTGEIPFTDYNPGDTVTIDIPGVFDEVDVQIHALVLVERPAGDYDVVLEFEGQTFDPTDPNNTSSVEPPLSNPPDDSGPGGGAVDDRCCSSNQPPYVCDPTVDTSVPVDCGVGGSGTTVSVTGDAFNLAAQGTDGFTLEIGATYRLIGDMEPGSDSHTMTAGLFNGSETFGMPFGSVLDATNVSHYEIDITPTTDACFNGYINIAPFFGANTDPSTVTLRVEYLSGPDERFEETGGACDDPEVGQHTTEQITLDGSGGGQTNFPYEPGSFQIIGGTVVPTETDPATGEFDTDLPAGTVVNVHYQIADATGTGAVNVPPPAGTTVIPQEVSHALLDWQGGGDLIVAHGNVGTAETFDLAGGNLHTATLDQNSTFTFTSPASGRGRWMTMRLLGGTGSPYAVTWPGSVTWIGGAPDEPDDGDELLLTFLTTDGGTSWIGMVAGGGTTTAGGGNPETIVAHGSTGAAETFDVAGGTVHTATLDTNSTFTFTSPTNDGAYSWNLKLAQDATGGRTVTWPGSVVWPGGTTPTLSTAANAEDWFVFTTLDGGTTWYGFPVGGSSGTAPATTRWEIVMTPGITDPPEPVWTPDGTDYVYAEVPV
jgi:hypothetical protein